MKSIIIRNFRELEELSEYWRELFENSLFKSPLLSFEYIKMWYSNFAESSDIRIYCIADGGKFIGILPLVLYKYRHLTFLQGLNNDHCIQNDPLVRKGYKSIFYEKMLESLIKDRRNWNLLRYDFSYSFSESPGLFADKYLNASHVRWCKKNRPTYSIDLNKSFDRYLKEDLSRNTRHKFMNCRNRINREGEWKIIHYTGQEAIASWNEFVEIENSGWKGENGSSIKKLNNVYSNYYEKFINLLFKMNLLNMFFFELHGEKIAGAFGYTQGDIFHYCKTGFNEKYRDLSPSNMLLFYIIEFMMNNLPDIKKFHLGPWDYGYKHKYTNEESYYTQLLIFSPTILGRMYNYAHTTREIFKGSP